MKKNTALLMMFCLTLLAPVLVRAEDVRRYEWKGYRFEYPSGWKITLNNENGNNKYVRLESDTRWPIALYVTLFGDVPAKPDEKYLAAPALAGSAVGTGIALELAGDLKSAAIAASDASIELASGPAPSALLSVYPADGRTFYHLHCFMAWRPDAMYSGTLMTQGARGAINEDAAFHRRTSEAYALLRSIRRIKPG